MKIRHFRFLFILFALCFFAGGRTVADEGFALHLLDVGQGQSVLIEADDCHMLIDGGGRSASSFVVSYLKQYGVDSIDCLAVSHYDEDHMSGTIGALNVFRCEKILLPSYTLDGPLYESFMTAASANEGECLYPKAGDTFSLGGANVQVIGPVRNDYDVENDRSLSFRITYGNCSFLICGDAEGDSEWDMVCSALPISSDVYVVSHHGSASSSTAPFLDAVSPTYALISCGKDNAYGHPSQAALSRLQLKGCTLYRTDLQGSIIAHSNGSEIWFDFDPCNDFTPGDSAASSEALSNLSSLLPQGSESEAGTSGYAAPDYRYVYNINTLRFHYPWCDSVAKMKEPNRLYTEKSRDELIKEGYQPCGECQP